MGILSGMFPITRLLPVLLLLLSSGCASVHLAGGPGAPTADRSLDAARADVACSERIWEALGSPPNIRVECRDGTVYLRGIVTTPESRRALVDFVQQRPDVKTVVDRLVIR